MIVYCYLEPNHILTEYYQFSMFRFFDFLEKHLPNADQHAHSNKKSFKSNNR